MLPVGDQTQCAESDREYITRFARRMVTDWGMSRLGLSVLSSVGPVRSDDPDVCAETARLVDEARATAAGLLADRRPLVEVLARRLLSDEAIDGDSVRRLVDEFARELVSW